MTAQLSEYATSGPMAGDENGGGSSSNDSGGVVVVGGCSGDESAAERRVVMIAFKMENDCDETAAGPSRDDSNSEPHAMVEELELEQQQQSPPSFSSDGNTADQKCMDLSNLNEDDQTFIEDSKCMDLSHLSDDDPNFIEGGNGGGGGGGVSGSMDGLQQYVAVGGNGGGTPVSAAAAAVNPSATGSELPDTKEGIEELCPVCGDKVSGYHYGLLTCESCKGFFKRTVQNKKVYTCVAERSCHIDKTQRKRCPFCRFQKCLEVGMKLEAVRADRMRGGRNKFGPMYKRDRARKLQMMRQRQMAVQTLRGGVVTSAGANNHHQFAMLAGDAVTLGQYPGSPITSSVSSLHIKQEIQIPQVSSLTSSPDSSPSPIAVALGQAGLGSLTTGAGGTTCVVNQHSQMTLQIVASANGNNNNNNTSSSNNNNSTGVTNMTGANGGVPPSQHQQHHQQAQQQQQQQQQQSVVPASTLLSVNKMWSPPSSPKNYLLSAHQQQQQQHHVPQQQQQQQQQQQMVVDGGGSSSTAATANGGGSGVKGMSPMIRDFVQGLDDREWQSSLFGLLQNQTYNQCEVDLFELMCKVLDQNLFSQVDWARNSVFFKDLKVDDQMKLLQHSWSDMLVLDHIHQHMHNNLANEIMLHNGQKFDLLALGLLGVTAMADCFAQVIDRLQELKFDVGDYICLKFLLLLNPDVKGIGNSKHVHEGHEQVLNALLDYCITANSQVQDKFTKLLSVLPEIHHIATRGEESLYSKHCSGGAPTQTLLMEMLHAKRK